jgi:PadR family transcriptional regulator, regulatory protein PadR
MEPITGDTLRGHLETMALAALERGEAHGFEVWRRLEEAGCGALRLKEGSLYPALYRLEEAGLVKSAWEGGPGGRRGPRRRVYRLTKKGTRRLAEGRQEWRQFVSVVGNILGALT